MTNETKIALRAALEELIKENQELIKQSDYCNIARNASTMCKIAETLGLEKATNFKLL
jgi:hypothetical protein